MNNMRRLFLLMITSFMLVLLAAVYPSSSSPGPLTPNQQIILDCTDESHNSCGHLLKVKLVKLFDKCALKKV